MAGTRKWSPWLARLALLAGLGGAAAGPLPAASFTTAGPAPTSSGGIEATEPAAAPAFHPAAPAPTAAVRTVDARLGGGGRPAPTARSFARCALARGIPAPAQAAAAARSRLGYAAELAAAASGFVSAPSTAPPLSLR